MRRTLTATVLAGGLLIASAGAASAPGGTSDAAQTHPGHQGAVASGAYHGVPTIHYHDVGAYDSWGGLVSATAKAAKGIPHAH